METENLELEFENSVNEEPAVEQEPVAAEQAEAEASPENVPAENEDNRAAALAAAEEKGYQRGLAEAQRQEAQRRMNEPDLWAVANRAGFQPPTPDDDAHVSILNELPPCVWDL
mgnify:CR=1 FL=1